MKLQRTSPVTGEVNEMDIPGLTPEAYARWTGGELIQKVLPDVSDEEREFIMTGCFGTDFEVLFPEEGEAAENERRQQIRDARRVDLSAAEAERFVDRCTAADHDSDFDEES